MKKLLLIVFLSGIISLRAQQTKVLWLGNSYTYENNLPAMFHDLALSGGDSVLYKPVKIQTSNMKPGVYFLKLNGMVKKFLKL